MCIDCRYQELCAHYISIYGYLEYVTYFDCRTYIANSDANQTRIMKFTDKAQKHSL